jgi:serine/threonine protein kinase
VRGQPYSLSSDVWALGITLAEVVLGHHPLKKVMGDSYNRGQEVVFWKLLELFGDECAPLHQAIREEAAHLSPAFVDFILQCVQAEEAHRPSCADMLAHPWITANATIAPASPSANNGGHTPKLHAFAPVAESPAEFDDFTDDVGGFSSDDDEERTVSTMDKSPSNGAYVSPGLRSTNVNSADELVGEWIVDVVAGTSSISHARSSTKSCESK